MHKLLATIGLTSLSIFSCLGSDPYPVNRNLNVLHYRFYLTVNDSTDEIEGKSEITFELKGNSPVFFLDLVKKQSDGMGMIIKGIGPAEIISGYQHTENNRIEITLKSIPTSPTTLTIQYSGVPADGLVIGNNKFSSRGFFGDNWPDRGHHWLACVDHPSDKASVEFIVTAPEHYDVVATGVLKEQSNLGNGTKQHHWSEETVVPVKVMTIGIARFAVKHLGNFAGVENSIWVFPENREAGFSDFSPAARIIEFYSKTWGPFLFGKLAHVQSKTRWGGLENAGAIFYAERAVNGKNQIENLIAHETAHQWFGDGVTEKDWHHVWLSEGFATYMTHYYNQQIHGEAARQGGMTKDRENILKHPRLNTSPVVDTTITDINEVLSTITYQKASFVLHMLRRTIGDDAFVKGVRNFYMDFKGGNALTSDLQHALEKSSGTPLDWFFKQWVYSPGTPEVDVVWQFIKGRKETKILVKQTGNSVWKFDLAIRLNDLKGEIISDESLLIDQKAQVFTIKAEKSPENLILDPEVNLLFRGKISRGKL